MKLATADLLPVRGDLQGDLRSWREVELPGLGRSVPERFPATVAWLLRRYAVQPPAYVQKDLRELPGTARA